MTVRAVVVDDEAVARRRVIRLLSEREDIEVVGEANGGRTAVEAIQRSRPDLVFLDVQMPDFDGFEVLRQLEGEKLPVVVFVTAYDDYALRAFEANAIDYLLKPYDSDRFTRAVDRALHWIGTARSGDEEDRLRSLLREVLRNQQAVASSDARAAPLDRFMIKKRGRAQFVRADEVDWIESDGNYVRIHVGTTSHLVRGTIAACADRLDPRRFVRVHRRYIVNIDRVSEVQPWFGGDYVIILGNGHKLRLSRNFRDHFQSRMLGE
jgi:two-component system, LytTR family, response regulator